MTSLTFLAHDGSKQHILFDCACACTRSGGQTVAPLLSCETCHGRGEYLTENGKSLMALVEKWSQVRA